MKISKKSMLSGLILSATLLTACQTPSNNLSFTPMPTQAMFNPANQNLTLNIVTRDTRPQNEISSYVRQGNVHNLYAQPNVVQLFDQIFKQDLNAKGFRITSAQANSNVIVNVKNFYAKVEQGDLRYKLNANIQLEVVVQGAKGQFVKNIGASRSYEGVFNANNDEIQKILTQTFNEITSTIYNNQEIPAAIHQYSSY